MKLSSKENLFLLIFSKEETDQEAVDIRQKCEDYVLNINDLQSEILIVKNPTRRVNEKNRSVNLFNDQCSSIVDFILQSRDFIRCYFIRFR